MKEAIYIPILIILLSNCTATDNKKEQSSSERIKNHTNKVILSSEIVWEKLNPARGDQSPQAGTIWGDRNGTEATGFLAKFVDGFSSPPHIHNVNYRAVVIKGTIHNDDPNAEPMWMKPGSFWTQPKGESHITSAQGDVNIALVEIDNGPYLVKPINEAFDSGERPVNVDVSNIVWLNNSQSNWISKNSNAEISFLWESGDNRGLFIKLPVGYQGVIEANGTTLHAVVISGNLDYEMPQSNDIKILDTGSYFGSTSRAFHTVNNNSDLPAVLYLRTNDEVKIK
jgi:mannose-6-phosphate isomerase-like protein (cupin superfamily)